MSANWPSISINNCDRAEIIARLTIQFIAQQAVDFGNLLGARHESLMTPAEAVLIFAAHLEVLSRELHLGTADGHIDSDLKLPSAITSH